MTNLKQPNASPGLLYALPRSIVFLGLILGLSLSFPKLWGQASLTLEKLPDNRSRLTWDLGATPEATVYTLQRSQDLVTWEDVLDIDLRDSASEAPPQEFLDADEFAISIYRLVQNGVVIAYVTTAADSAEVYGFADEFKDRLAAIGEISVEAFLEHYDHPEQYVESLSYDPLDPEFETAFREGAGRTLTDGWGFPITPNKSAFTLNSSEKEKLREHGFVVSGRYGSHSYTDSFYEIFRGDLPVFVSLDSILQAWHQTYRSILEETEAYTLSAYLRTILIGMRGQLPGIEARVAEDLVPSLHDADLFLTVALSLLENERHQATLGAATQEASQILTMIDSLEPQSVSLFGRQNPEIVDFSQFRPRGHYTNSPGLEQYFRAMMWLGRVDFRVAGPPKIASPRELGTALILQEALNGSGQLNRWTAVDRILQTFVGLTDSMTVPQLTSLLNACDLSGVDSVQALTQLATLQAKIEASDLGAQGILSHGFFKEPGQPVVLPRSFTLFGQRFVMDSWAMSHLVFDRIKWNGADVRRRLPSGLDVAFTVLGNTAAAPILADRIANADGVQFRDGFPIQHHLGALHDVFNTVGEADWKDNMYTSWLHVLRQWSVPLDDSIPEVFRTREWAKKTLNSQLASWTHLRHNTVLYAKQSSTVPVLCSFPHTYLEPNLGAWQALTDMVRLTRNALQTHAGATLFADDHQTFLANFESTCARLTEITRKQNQNETLTNGETLFLKDMVEIMVDYVGQRTYSGWYPKLYYISEDPLAALQNPFGFDEGLPGQHPSDIWDPVVTDVHTDFPSDPDGDPGTVLHQGVGNTTMLFVTVNCDENRMYVGPVSTYYEFTSGPGNFDRMTDEQWRKQLRANDVPEAPEWAQGHRIPGRVSIPSYALPRN